MKYLLVIPAVVIFMIGMAVGELNQRHNDSRRHSCTYFVSFACPVSEGGVRGFTYAYTIVTFPSPVTSIYELKSVADMEKKYIPNLNGEIVITAFTPLNP